MGSAGKKRKKLIVPSCHDDKGDEGHYSVSSWEEKIVRDYTGYDFGQIDSLTVFEFWLFLRDAVIYSCQQTDEGKKYLEKCWAEEQMEPDRESLRRQFGNKNKGTA